MSHADPRQQEVELTGSKVTIRSTRLDLRDILLPDTKLLVDTNDVLPDTKRGHAVRVVGDTTKVLCALSSREGLPPGLGTTVAGVHYRKACQRLTPTDGCRYTHVLPSP